MLLPQHYTKLTVIFARTSTLKYRQTDIRRKEQYIYIFLITDQLLLYKTKYQFRFRRRQRPIEQGRI